MRRRQLLSLLAFLLAASPLHAEQSPGSTSIYAARKKALENDDAGGGGSSMFDVREGANRPRSDIVAPLFSFLVPGLDQWWEGQTYSAMAYSGIAVAGYAYADHIAFEDGIYEKKRRERVAKEEGEDDGEDDKEETGLDAKDVALRKATFGALVAQGAGGFSLYHSFRTAVRTRKGHGQYEFLRYEETPADIFAAPFRFQYLAHTRTWVPLLIGAALMELQLHGEDPEDMEKTSFTSADGFFTGAYSYNAGTHEEAVFRGWMMPVMYEYWRSEFWSNAAQSVVFALAHLNTNSMPVPQLLLGYHLGYVTQENGWRIGESVFIHTWWDVLAFATIFHYKQTAPEEKASLIKPVLWLPPFQYYF